MSQERLFNLMSSMIIRKHIAEPERSKLYYLARNLEIFGLNRRIGQTTIDFNIIIILLKQIIKEINGKTEEELESMIIDRSHIKIDKNYSQTFDVFSLMYIYMFGIGISTSFLVLELFYYKYREKIDLFMERYFCLPRGAPSANLKSSTDRIKIKIVVQSKMNARISDTRWH